jgi:hypothetical protein
VQLSANHGSASTHAQLAQQAAAGLAASSLAAALLAAPADAAQLQQLLPPPDPQHSSGMQLVGLRRAAVAVPKLTLADVTLPQVKQLNDLPSLNNPWQVLGYLLNHPVAALFVGGGLAVVVPRLVRFSVRFILVPAGVALLLYLAARNPGFVWGGVSSTASAVVQHPVATSVVILAGSSLLLSPYILLAGTAVVLLTGTKLLPGFLRPALPGPVSEALHQVDILQGQTRSALDSLASAVQTAPALKDGKK